MLRATEPTDPARAVSYLRIGLAAGAAILIGLIWWRVQLSFTQGAEIDKQRDHIDALTVAAARDNRTTGEMAKFRGQQSDALKAFRDDLSKKPLTNTVVKYVDKATGEKVVCVERDPVRYRVLFNEAVAGAAGVP